MSDNRARNEGQMTTRREFAAGTAVVTATAVAAPAALLAHEKERKGKMKVLMINGSPRRNGNTTRALKEVADALAKEGVDSEVVRIGVQPVRKHRGHSWKVLESWARWW